MFITFDQFDTLSFIWHNILLIGTQENEENYWKMCK